MLAVKHIREGERYHGRNGLVIGGGLPMLTLNAIVLSRLALGEENHQELSRAPSLALENKMLYVLL